MHGVIRKVLQALIGVGFVFSYFIFGFYYVSDPAISAKENNGKTKSFFAVVKIARRKTVEPRERKIAELEF